jgi:hypothetical protein
VKTLRNGKKYKFIQTKFIHGKPHSRRTSQFYLDDSISDKIQSQPPYSNHGPRPLTNNEDFIYTGPSTDGLVQTNSGEHLMLNLTSDDKQGYTGTFNVGVEAKQSTK